MKVFSSGVYELYFHPFAWFSSPEGLKFELKSLEEVLKAQDFSGVFLCAPKNLDELFFNEENFNSQDVFHIFKNRHFDLFFAYLLKNILEQEQHFEGFSNWVQNLKGLSLVLKEKGLEFSSVAPSLEDSFKILRRGLPREKKRDLGLKVFSWIFSRKGLDTPLKETKLSIALSPFFLPFPREQESLEPQFIKDLAALEAVAIDQEIQSKKTPFKQRENIKRERGENEKTLPKFLCICHSQEEGQALFSHFQEEKFLSFSKELEERIKHRKSWFERYASTVILGVLFLALFVGPIFFKQDFQIYQGLGVWVISHSVFSALAVFILRGTWLSIFVACVLAPLTALIPLIGVGMFVGLCELHLRKPTFSDFKTLHEDFTLKGLYKNKVLHTLALVFFTGLANTLASFVSFGAVLR